MNQVTRWLVAGALLVSCGAGTSNETALAELGWAGDVLTVAAVADFTPQQACGSAKVPGGQPIPALAALDDDATQAVTALGEHVEGAPFVARYEYEIFSRTPTELILLGSDDDGRLSSAEFRRVGEAWKPKGWGTCEWGADRFELAKWVIDERVDVDGDSQVLHLVAADNCGVVTDAGHEVVVVADYGEDTIEIAVWEALDPPPNEGDQFGELGCPLDQTVFLAVVLTEPIDGRAIIGAYDSPYGFVGD